MHSNFYIGIKFKRVHDCLPACRILIHNSNFFNRWRTEKHRFFYPSPVNRQTRRVNSPLSSCVSVMVNPLKRSFNSWLESMLSFGVASTAFSRMSATSSRSLQNPWMPKILASLICFCIRFLTFSVSAGKSFWGIIQNIIFFFQNCRRYLKFSTSVVMTFSILFGRKFDPYHMYYFWVF